MNKSTQKNKRYNTLAVKRVSEKYGYSERYVRGCVKGDFKGIMPDKIKGYYKEIDNAITETVDKLQKSDS